MKNKAPYAWNIKTYVDGKPGIPFYMGFKTKKEAQEEAERWNEKGINAEVIKYNQ